MSRQKVRRPDMRLGRTLSMPEWVDLASGVEGEVIGAASEVRKYG